jgi:hypothetical protein
VIITVKYERGLNPFDQEYIVGVHVFTVVVAPMIVLYVLTVYGKLMLALE